MWKAIPIPIGSVFGRLVTVGDIFRVKNSYGVGHRIHVLCRCSCGSELPVESTALRGGLIQSCGCMQKDNARSLGLAARTHGESSRGGRGRESTEYRIRSLMISRCDNPKRPEYIYYGGRGIKVCDRWRESFENFLADMGRRPTTKHSIERINVNGNYEPSNCKWATMKEQQRNRRNNRVVIFRGETLCVTEVAERLGMSRTALYQRLNRGLTIEEATNTPVRQKMAK